MNRVYDNYGPSAVFGRSYGWMSTGKVNAAINLQQRLLNLRGGFIQCINLFDGGYQPHPAVCCRYGRSPFDELGNGVEAQRTRDSLGCGSVSYQ